MGIERFKLTREVSASLYTGVDMAGAAKAGLMMLGAEECRAVDLIGVAG